MNEFENAICHENTLASLTPVEAARIKQSTDMTHPPEILERQDNLMHVLIILLIYCLGSIRRHLFGSRMLCI